MKVLYFGDVFAKPGRDALQKAIKKISAQHDVDFLVVNGENACHGNGILPEMAQEFFDWGVDVHHDGQSCMGSAPDHPFHGNDHPSDSPGELPGSSGVQNFPGRGATVVEVQAASRPHGLASSRSWAAFSWTRSIARSERPRGKSRRMDNLGIQLHPRRLSWRSDFRKAGLRPLHGRKSQRRRRESRPCADRR